MEAPRGSAYQAVVTRSFREGRSSFTSGIIVGVMRTKSSISAMLSGFFVCCILFSRVLAQSPPPTSGHAVVLRAARLLDIESGKIITPGEVLVQGERIAEVGSAVKPRQERRSSI